MEMEINERDIIQKAKLIGEKIRGINDWEELCKNSTKSIIEFYDKKMENKNSINKILEITKNDKLSSYYLIENK
jgi:hypothetical protein